MLLYQATWYALVNIEGGGGGGGGGGGVPISVAVYMTTWPALVCAFAVNYVGLILQPSHTFAPNFICTIYVLYVQNAGIREHDFPGNKNSPQ